MHREGYKYKRTSRPRSVSPNVIVAWTRLFALALCFSFTYAVIFNPLQGRANQQMVGFDQNNTIVELNVGQVLQIELPGNAGTGFQWRLDELDNSFWLLMGSDKKISGKDNPDFVGNPYLKSWTFKALQAGNSRVRLLYYRPWEGKEMAVKNFEIKVVVKP